MNDYPDVLLIMTKLLQELSYKDQGIGYLKAKLKYHEEINLFYSIKILKKMELIKYQDLSHAYWITLKGRELIKK